MFNGRRYYRHPHNIGRGRGRGGIGRGIDFNAAYDFEPQNDHLDQDRDRDPLQYFMEQERDEEAEDDLRAATARHEQRVINRAANRIAADNEEAKVQVSDVQRMTEEVKLAKTNAVRRRAEIALEKEQRELAVMEEINALERRINFRQ